MGIRTDLAVERLELAEKSLPHGAIRSEETIHGIPMVTVQVEDTNAAEVLGKPIGKYLTVECTPFRKTPENFEAEVMAVAETVSRLLPDGPILVAGLGNESITPDALGPEAVNLMLATRHISPELAASLGIKALRPVSVIAPGVLGQTGMETCEILAALVKETSPAAVIAIDALAAGDPARLGATVQVCNTGISPGSGVANRRKELSEKTLGIPVIAMGVPTVVDFSVEGSEPMMVTPREVDLVIENAAKTVAFALNKALQPELELEEILALIQ